MTKGTNCTLAKIKFKQLIKDHYICGSKGDLSEWPNEHAWKACLPQGNEGSNPSVSAELDHYFIFEFLNKPKIKVFTIVSV